MADVSHVSMEDLWTALTAAQDAFDEISKTLYDAMSMDELGDKQLTPAEAYEFRAKHWQTLWDSSLATLKTVEAMPARFSEILKI